MPPPEADSRLAAVGGRLVVALALTTAVAGLLTLLGVTTFASAWGLSAVVVGALIGVTASDNLTRGVTIDMGTIFGGGLAIHRTRSPSGTTGEPVDRPRRIPPRRPPRGCARCRRPQPVTAASPPPR